MKNEKLHPLTYPTMIIGFMIIIYVGELITGIDLAQTFGVRPREYKSLIFMWPASFLHVNYYHLVGNITMLTTLLVILYKYFRNHATVIFTNIWFYTTLLTWFLGRPETTHIGASGLLYGLLSYLITTGLLIWRGKLFMLSLILLFFYSTVFTGVFNPQEPMVSWEMHFFGSLVGAALAVKIAPLKIKEQIKERLKGKNGTDDRSEGENISE